ncbi:hypothetical protein B296_00012350 [Ensete ventricosum]|uniref:Uncharacterized protein n=1 Tax=Ensete ventricosum TaxID=4639 RepID=A0A427A391_ENSVE|nr:hypothetical protein B296_00012350 [Ensete ventricosum]
MKQLNQTFNTVHHRRNGSRLPLSSTNRSDDLAFVSSFLPHHCFRLCISFHRRRRGSQLHQLPTDTSKTSSAHNVTICSFCRCSCCCPPLSLLLSAVSSVITAVI